ncbi:carboxypeptidase-like regulatory domain-containing protein [Streptomyces paludis]|uniref:Carboxypeptidase regulatory-like domain-containing protein n=1 Tax=Streptomyces paludis TaxID=2282738 RepID=A0A345HSE7_9ACTN|nr:carboxypeptidase-like regulatory domain-containing protein [Streptomyces paludis]AXG79621.1 carboxypeptidase regulatory-like domain-containing protein [Streptomyces paludis]
MSPTNPAPRPAGVIRGIVLDAAGAPAPGVRVAITDGPVPVPDVAALTDGDGRFALAAPADGTYSVSCYDHSATGPAGTATARVTVIAGAAVGPADTEVRLRLGRP